MSSHREVQRASFDPSTAGASRWSTQHPMKPIGWTGDREDMTMNAQKYAWSSWLPNSTADVLQESRHLEAAAETYPHPEEISGLFYGEPQDVEAHSNAYLPWPASKNVGNAEMEGLRQLRNCSSQVVGASPAGRPLGHFSGYTSQLEHWPQASDLPLKIPFGVEAAEHVRDSLAVEKSQDIAGSNQTHSAEPGPPGQGPGPPQGSPQPPQQEQLSAKPNGQTQAYPPAPAHWDDGQCRWHKSAETVGIISEDGHVFTKTAGPRRSRVNNRGSTVELASICMVFDASLRSGGVHRYCYEILDGELGAADGVGFVFDSKVRRNNIQRMRSVFLNQRGRICLRNNQQVTKLEVQLPPLTVGVVLHLLVDLDTLVARFNVGNGQGVIGGSADVSLEALFDTGLTAGQLRSGFFCAVVTGSITVGLH